MISAAAGRLIDVIPIVMIKTERRMPEHSQSSLERRAQNLDGQVFVPRTDSDATAPWRPMAARPPAAMPSDRFEPPVSALGPLFTHRLERIHRCRVRFSVDINSRPTNRVLGGYYRSRCLVRVYSHDTVEGRRPMEELFGTYLHEVAHHLEYTEPFTFGSRACRRVPGLMHSKLFWRILSELKLRWAELKAQRTI
jgi:hypothetical protein